jgi:hypothetical protein
MMKDILSRKLDLEKKEPSIGHWCDTNLFWEFYSMSKTCREKKRSYHRYLFFSYAPFIVTIMQLINYINRYTLMIIIVQFKYTSFTELLT